MTSDHLTPEYLTISAHGQQTVLNAHMIERQGLGKPEVDALKATHVERHRLFAEMMLTNDIAEIRRLAQAYDDLEFDQQAILHFNQDVNFHQWFTVPHCTCPRQVNREYRGERRVQHDCPVHRDWMPVPRNGQALPESIYWNQEAVDLYNKMFKPDQR